MTVPFSAQRLIDCLVTETGASDPVAAIRMKAQEVVSRYCSTFGEPVLPFCMETLASFLGIGRCPLPPIHSDDAELVPDGLGGVQYRVNPDQPETRQRFSIAHEICHTLFADYQQKVWCRPDARYRRRDNPDDFLEMLCDIGAAELLLPLPWFERDASNVKTAAELLSLSVTYRASREAVLRRFVELHQEAAAAVYFSWKLKPLQIQAMPSSEERNLFGMNPYEEACHARKLRIDYSIHSAAFQTTGHYLPSDKSVENAGPLYNAASRGVPCDGEWDLALGQAAGKYRIQAVPLWTNDDELGPNGENAVAAIIYPLTIRVAAKKRKSSPMTSSLFGDSVYD